MRETHPGRRRSLSALVLAAVLLVGLSGCMGTPDVGDVDDVLYPDGTDGASASTTDTEAGTPAAPAASEPDDGASTTSRSTITTAATTPAASSHDDDSRDDGEGSGSGSSDDGDGANGDGSNSTPTTTTEDDARPDVPEHEDSTFDVAHSQNIVSNDDGTTTVEGYVVSLQGDYTDTDLVVVVEIYDLDGNWIGSEWDEIGDVTEDEETPYSVKFDVPRDEIGDYAADVNGVSYFEGDEHYNAPGQCVEIQGDGPNDEEAESIDQAAFETDDGTVVVGEVFNGANHDMRFVRVFVSVYGKSSDRLATETALIEDVPAGETRRFAVPFDETGVADVRVDPDELGIAGGELRCRPPH